MVWRLWRYIKKKKTGSDIEKSGKEKTLERKTRERHEGDILWGACMKMLREIETLRKARVDMAANPKKCYKVLKMLDKKGGENNNTVLIQYCADYTMSVNYDVLFKQVFPVPEPPYIKFTMDSTTPAVTVPLIPTDDHVLIITEGTDIIELKLQYVSRAAYRPDVDIFAITVIGLVLLLIVLQIW